jgi:uncharacterized protein
MSAALITGASTGIGREYAYLCAQEGYDVVLVARGEAKLQALAADIHNKTGRQAYVFARDLSQPDAATVLFNDIVCTKIQVEVLINNAGFGLLGKFWELDAKEQMEMVQLNMNALTMLSRYFLPDMIEKKRGMILNVASTAAFQPGPLMAVYYATKAYVLSFSEAIANELRGSGVTVTCFCPGATHTGFAKRAGSENSRLFKQVGAMSAEKVARDGYRALMSGRTVAISGAHNWFVAQSVRFAPRKLVTAVSRWVAEKVS